MNQDKIYLIVAMGLVGLMYIYIRKRHLNSGFPLKVLKTIICLSAVVFVVYISYKNFNVMKMILLAMTLMVSSYVIREFWKAENEN